MTSPASADVIVIGLGAMGSAALLRLARAGASVIGIDRHHPPHDLGSSHGETRITRLAVGEGDEYAPLVARSHALWRELEAESGESLLLQNGGLILGKRGSTALHHGKTSFVERTIAVAERAGIAHEVLDAETIRRRFPQFTVQPQEFGYYEPEAGMLFPERCIGVQLRLAQEAGAAIRCGETVLDLRQVSGGVEVTTDRGRISAGQAVVAAGAWLPSLLGGAAVGIAKVHRQVLHWFAPETAAEYAAERCPVFIWIHGDDPEGFFYGFPTAPGGSGVKVATEFFRETTHPDIVDRTVSPNESAALHEAHVAGRLRGVTPRVIRSAVCLYTTTPDAGFVIDSLPGSDRILCVSACSGHGFKHSAALGEVVAARLLDQAPSAHAFRFERFAAADATLG